jgi:hypothetical protein
VYVFLCGSNVVKLFGQKSTQLKKTTYIAAWLEKLERKLHFPKAPRHETISNLTFLACRNILMSVVFLDINSPLLSSTILSLLPLPPYHCVSSTILSLLPSSLEKGHEMSVSTAKIPRQPICSNMKENYI